LTVAAKISGVQFILVGIFLIVFTLVFSVMSRLNVLIQAEHTFWDLGTAVNDLNYKGKNLLIGEETLDILMSVFYKSAEVLKKEITELEDSKELEVLKAEGLDSWQRLLPISLETLTNFQNLEAKLSEIKDDASVRGLKKNGLFRTRINLELMGGDAAFGFLLNSASETLVRSQYAFEVAVLPLSNNILADIKEQVSELSFFSVLVLLLAAVFSVVLALVLGLLLSRRMVSRIRLLNTVLTKAAQKDLDQRCDDRGNDEIAKLGANLNSVIDGLEHFLHAASQTGQNMSQVNQDLLKTTEENRSSMEDITENVEASAGKMAELGGRLVELNTLMSSISQELNLLDKDTDDQKRRSQISGKHVQVISESIQGIQEVSDRLQEENISLQAITDEGGLRLESTNSLIQSAYEGIEAVSEFTELIRYIADQTGILSLNAAIESAHAGEAGKGFSIVAGEIQKLAESTTENSLRISESLREIADRISEARETSRYSAEAFEKIRNQVGSSGALFKGIHDQVEELGRSAREVDEAMSQLGETAGIVHKRSSYLYGLTAQSSSKANEAVDFGQAVLRSTESIDLRVKTIYASFEGLNSSVARVNVGLKRLNDIIGSYKVRKVDCSDAALANTLDCEGLEEVD